MSKKPKYHFLDRNGNKHLKAYINGMIVEDEYNEIWFQVDIRRTSAIYVSPVEPTPVLDAVDRKYLYSIIKDSLFNGEPAFIKPDYLSGEVTLQ